MSNSDNEKELKISQGRSPAYPYISLGKAVERMEKVGHAGVGRNAFPPETFYKVWGLGAQSSGARQTMAALHHFGLVEYVGRGKDRKVKLSDLALDIFFDQVPGSKNRKKAIKKAALEPAIHSEIWENFGFILPDDAVLKTFLMRDRGYNNDAADALINEYKATLEFAGLTEPEDAEADLGSEQDKEDIPTGAESTNSDRWKQEGNPHDSLAETYRKAVFPLDEGDVSIIFPRDLSRDALDELDDYLQVFLKKEKRKKSDEPAGGS